MVTLLKGRLATVGQGIWLSDSKHAAFTGDLGTGAEASFKSSLTAFLVLSHRRVSISRAERPCVTTPPFSTHGRCMDALATSFRTGGR